METEKITGEASGKRKGRRAKVFFSQRSHLRARINEELAKSNFDFFL